MAQYDVTIIENGPRNFVAHVSIVGDGGGELDDEVLIDPATDFVPAITPGKPAMTLDGLCYDLTGFNAWLEYDYLTTDTPLWTMSDDSSGDFDFSRFGGFKDRSNPNDGQGKLKISTSGLGDGDRGTLVLCIRKG